MCSKPKAPKATPPPDLLVTARDGEAGNLAASRRKRGTLRLDLNAPTAYSDLTIPKSG